MTLPVSQERHSLGRILEVELTCTNHVTTAGQPLRPTPPVGYGPVCRVTRQVACSFDRLVLSVVFLARYVTRGRRTRCLQTTWRTTRRKNTFDPPPTPIGASQEPSRGWLKEEPSVPARDQVSKHREQVSGVATRAANTSSEDYGVHEFSGQEAMSAP